MSDLIIIADLDTILQIVVFLIIVISSLAGQFFKGNAEKKRRKRPIRPVEGGERPQPDPERSRLEDEIESMLRRAVGREPEVVEPELVEPEVVVHREPEPTSTRRPMPISAELVELPEEPARESIANRRMESDISKRSRRLGSAIERADERLESRLHRTFDHKLGQLESRASVTGPPTSATDPQVTAESLKSSLAGDGQMAERIAEMLRSPNDLPTAIVLSEILRRPEF